MDPLIDTACEKAMIEYIYRGKAIRFVDLDTVWTVFMENYDVPPEIEESDLKLHFICMDKSSNKWDLEEDIYLYLKFGSWAEEVDQNPIILEDDGKTSHIVLGF